MDIIGRINELMAERQWTDYKLSVESGLSTSTIANMHRRNTVPSIATLESICNAFGITLVEFFSDNLDYVYLSDSEKNLHQKWNTLSKEQQELILHLMEQMK